MTITSIIRAVAAHYDLRAAELTSKRRVARQVLPRHVAMYLAREMTGASYPEIGRHFRCDHTTVLFAVRKIRKAFGDDVTITSDVSKLTDEVAALAPPRMPAPLVEMCPHCRRPYIDAERRDEALGDVRNEIHRLSEKIELLERVAS